MLQFCQTFYSLYAIIIPKDKEGKPMIKAKHLEKEVL